MTVVIGWLVAVIDIAQFVPQARRALRLRTHPRALHGLSLWTWCVATGQAVLWVVYGFATDRLPIAIPNVVIAPLSALVLLLALRSRNGSRVRSRRGAERADAAAEQ
ncbi:MAG TPA: hypothetical protein VGL26_10370 [Jatrophihabitans sp.]|jgi:uncharacterized protein with PQ loop repeat